MDIGISGSFTAMNYLTLYGDKDAALGQEKLAGRKNMEEKEGRPMYKMRKM